MLFFEQSASDYARRHVRLWAPMGCLVITVGVSLWISAIKYKAVDLGWFPAIFTIGGVLSMTIECLFVVPMLKLPPTAVVRVTLDAERLRAECPSRYFGESFDVRLDDVAKLAVTGPGNELSSIELKDGTVHMLPCASGLNLDRAKLGKQVRELRPAIPTA